jgi:hypothetical protein
LPSDIRRLALPYLSVLEARLERAGNPDPGLPSRLLKHYVLGLSDPKTLVAIFEASKPTLPQAQRIIKSDQDLAKIALAVAYGTNAKDEAFLTAMGKVFECLPALEDATPSQVREEPSLFDLVTSSTPTISSTTISDLVDSFSPSALSTALDALDVHLASAETFLRYSAPVPLSWFLTSHRDVSAQRTWATRMARTSASGGGGRVGNEGEFESEDEWVGLMEDMAALGSNGDDEEEEQDALRKPFWLIKREELLRIFFGGLLAAGSASASPLMRFAR